MEKQTEEKDMGTIEILRLPKDYVLKIEGGTYRLSEEIEIRIEVEEEEEEKPKEQNVIRIAKALVEAGFTVLKYDCCPSGELAIELKVIPSHLLEDKINDSKS